MKAKTNMRTKKERQFVKMRDGNIVMNRQGEMMCIFFS